MNTNEFVTKTNEPSVWDEVLVDNDFTQEELQFITESWDQYREKRGPIDWDEEYKKIELHKENKALSLTSLWSQWGGGKNVSTTVDYDYSSTLEYQRENVRDRDKLVKDASEMQFAGALMCCDTPERTIAFLLATFCDSHGIGLGERLKLLPEVARYVELHMQIAFLCKKKANIGRPSDYELNIGLKKSISEIPHPNHQTDPSGHSTVGQAMKKILHEKYPHCNAEWLKTCDEVGEARITCGIHWWTDHQSAIDNVETYHEMIINKMNNE